MNKHMLSILVLTLASLTCLQTIMPTASAETSEPVPPTATAMQDPQEDYAGAVFYPEVPESTPTTGFCATVTASQALHMRAEPNDKAAVLAYLKAGEQVKVIDLGRWWKIEAHGKTGYANAKYLQEGCE
jgi:uncharacterized protein YgiM (DUF1202 family)